MSLGPLQPCLALNRTRGATLVLALLWIAGFTLLGLLAACLGQMEGNVSRNELRAARAEYGALSALEAVVSWFDDPAAKRLLPSPSAELWIRELRSLDLDGAGPAPAVVSTPQERYKWSIDRDADGRDDLLEPPYEGQANDRFLGGRHSPDLRLEDRLFLDRLGRRIFGSSSSGAAERLRILRIDIHAPPFVRTPLGWRPRGIARVRVLVSLESRGRRVAVRVALGRVEAIRYAGPHGPLHSCADIRLGPRNSFASTDWPAGWGAVTAQGDFDPGRGFDELPLSLPRSGPGPARAGRHSRIWGEDFVAQLQDYRARLAAAGEGFGDPWLRIEVGGALTGAASSAAQPVPSPWKDWRGASAVPHAAMDRSHVIQHARVGCPGYDYSVWKRLATSGASGVRHFRWSVGDRFRESGRGPARSLEQWTAGREGVFFFDTRDGAPPAPDSSNLTPAVKVSAPADWDFNGLLYVNAVSVGFHGVQGVARQLFPPGEPYEDRDRDGAHDPDEPWIDLLYPGQLDQPYRAAAVVGRRAQRSPRGIPAVVALRGVLYTSGSFDVTGDGIHYGSVIAVRGIRRSGAGPRVSRILWDASIPGWPRTNPVLPRVFLASRWVGAP